MTSISTASFDIVDSRALSSPAMASGARVLSWQSRACPDDFDVVFVEKGRLECEIHYRARRTTVTRWLEERGKHRLITDRAAFVRYQRQIAKDGKGGPNGNSPTNDNSRDNVDPKLARMAATFLQHSRNGGWVVYQLDCGAFMVGTARKNPSQMIEFAQRKGFDLHRAQEQIAAFAEPV